MGLFDRFKKSSSSKAGAQRPAEGSSDSFPISAGNATIPTTPAFFTGPPKKSWLARLFEMFKARRDFGLPKTKGKGGGTRSFWTDGKPPMERGFIYALLLALAYMGADLTLIANRDKLLPDEAPQAPPKNQLGNLMVQRSEYDRIGSRNPFNADGMIPDALRSKDQDPLKMDGPPVPTVLSQLTLVGTLVHINGKRSVATIEIKTPQEKILPFFVGDNIEDLADLTKIERKK